VVRGAGPAPAHAAAAAEELTVPVWVEGDDTYAVPDAPADVSTAMTAAAADAAAGTVAAAGSVALPAEDLERVALTTQFQALVCSAGVVETLAKVAKVSKTGTGAGAGSGSDDEDDDDDDDSDDIDDSDADADADPEAPARAKRAPTAAAAAAAAAADATAAEKQRALDAFVRDQRYLAVFRCKKCRKALFTERDLETHEALDLQVRTCIVVVVVAGC
jgi:hypothetical protein